MKMKLMGVLLAVAACIYSASASVVITIQEQGSDVVTMAILLLR